MSYLCFVIKKTYTMKTVIVTIKAGQDLDRTDLEKIENESFSNVQSLLDELSEIGRSLYLEGVIKVWELSDFMDAWNDTDDHKTLLNVKNCFIGYAKVNF